MGMKSLVFWFVVRKWSREIEVKEVQKSHWYEEDRTRGQ